MRLVLSLPILSVGRPLLLSRLMKVIIEENYLLLKVMFKEYLRVLVQ
jgi:hypothetical protein